MTHMTHQQTHDKLQSLGLEHRALKDKYQALLLEHREVSNRDLAAFQNNSAEWCEEAFGYHSTYDVAQRGWRFIEEALELIQALSLPKEDLLELVDYVYGRPLGSPNQEVGGVMLTLSCLCTSAGISMAVEGAKELNRVEQPEVMARVREKNLSKPLNSALPGVTNAVARNREEDKATIASEYRRDLNRPNDASSDLSPEDVLLGDHDCEDSPTGSCAYDRLGYNATDECLFCGQPGERK